MNYYSVLLLGNSYIALKENNNYYQLYLDKKIYNNGLIINNEGFIKYYIKFIQTKKLSKFLWKKKIKIIYNSLYHQNDIVNLYNIFKDLNYKSVQPISEKQILNLNQKTCYLLVDNILRLFYIDKNNTKKVLVLDRELFYAHEIRLLISNRVKKKTLYIIGKLPQNYLFENLNYYYYESFDEFFLKNIL
ncbi:MAG: hypothetical protein E7167_04870 [Firmicutes bacterium]|nr:hypothetical protein [Bacillota bacterium]